MIINNIGNTPMIKIDDYGSEIYFKLEGMNIFGSAKDRAAKHVIEQLYKKGIINKDTTIIESSSGNMGIALAAICKVYGNPFICVTDPHILPINEYIIKSYGAKIVKVDKSDENNSYLNSRINFVKKLELKIPNAYWFNQYNNSLVCDALKFNFNDYDRIVANLPYTITEPFLMGLAINGTLDYSLNDFKGSNVKSVTLVVSQNSTRKMVAPIQIVEDNHKHSNPEFGIIGAICKSLCDVDIVGAIPSEAFFPEPAVTSFIVNLTPKSKKTTVDRIVTEFLIDKSGFNPSIQKVYQKLLAQEKIYKPSKHKGKMMTQSYSTSFTSSSIENRNIYDLSNGQISQLFQDLVRNDIRIKGRSRENQDQVLWHNNMDVSQYFQNGEFIYDEFTDGDDDYEGEDYDCESHDSIILREKSEKKYGYLYDRTLYELLLSRGWERKDPAEFQRMFRKEEENSKTSKV